MRQSPRPGVGRPPGRTATVADMILLLAARPVTPRTAHPRPARRRSPYARIFTAPGTRAFAAAGLLARLPMGMLGVSAVLMIAGVLLFAAQRRTEPPAVPRPSGRTLPQPPAGGTPTPLRIRGLPPLLLTFLATGAVFGSLEVVTIAYVDAHGFRPAAGALLALQAAGSGATGLLLGLLPAAARPARRFLGCVAAMAALLTLPPAAAATGAPVLLAAALLTAGTATAPVMVTGMGLVQSRTPAGRLNEGMTLAVTALLTGIAAGSATGGWAAEHLPSSAAGYAVPAAAAALALAITAAAAAAAARRS
ncbi:hypothetical protein AB0C11_00260 [Streptomyces sp. NPDC039016]|uniref:hypothetical protein n=3 Tax=unclassified Streptomyces TaxID=2593676 RepID=UPI0033C24848